MCEELKPSPSCESEKYEAFILKLSGRDYRMIASAKELYNICRFWLMTENRTGLIINHDVHTVMQKTYDYINNGGNHEDE